MEECIEERTHMENLFLPEPFNRIMRNFLGGGLSQIRKKSIGGGLWGFAIPVALFVIEDITRPDGVVVPLCKWALNKAAKVRVVEVSAQSFGASSKGNLRGRTDAR
jgi:hypothetical protein